MYVIIFSLIERNEVYPRNANDATKTTKQRNNLLESFFARSKDDPILDEEADGAGLHHYISLINVISNHTGFKTKESLNKIGELKAKYHFGDYGSYKDMLKYMRTIEFYYPHITKLIRIGLSHEDAPIEGLKVILGLVSGFGKDPVITKYLKSLNIYIFPCLNPDGYEYTRSQPIPQVSYQQAAYFEN
ncbi:unnamed protein product [Gongylonema pulchrum]|uniref:Peptidase_M14 domain-containing protein n=1 Tax=Gongylonema pulchrum TaxID=637853 RepID=A0A183EL56_9BILA|nr:unnamed protein product [Gongylonema pulchrum]